MHVCLIADSLGGSSNTKWLLFLHIVKASFLPSFLYLNGRAEEIGWVQSRPPLPLPPALPPSLPHPSDQRTFFIMPSLLFSDYSDRLIRQRDIEPVRMACIELLIREYGCCQKKETIMSKRHQRTDPIFHHYNFAFARVCWPILAASSKYGSKSMDYVTIMMNTCLAKC